MSLHKSLKQTNALRRRRNVLTRAERIERLKEDEEWEDGMSPFGLPKVEPATVTAPSARPLPLEEEAEGEAEAETDAETEGTEVAE